MCVDVGIEVKSCSCSVRTQMALIDNTLLIWGKSKLVFSIILGLHIAVHSVAVGHNAGGLSFGLVIVKYSIVQSLEKLGFVVDI